MGSDFFDARLSSLTTNTCKLEPAFDPEVENEELPSLEQALPAFLSLVFPSSFS